MPSRNRLRALFAVCCLLGVIGCDAKLPATPASPGPTQPAGPAPSSRFDQANCGTIAGHVTWDGPIPEIPAFRAHSSGMPHKSHLIGLVRPNPNSLEVDSETHGVHQAVVMLRGVNAASARPWDFPPISIQLRRHCIELFEGDMPARTGFVQRGAEVAMSSADPFFHCLRARGAAVFSLPFVEAGPKTMRTLDRTGLVQLTSGAGYYWACRYIFVDDHPYYARSDRTGIFRVAQVPSGKYRIACWHPSWQVIRQERDPESSLISRVVFADPIEIEQEVTVQPQQVTRVEFRLSTP